MGLQKKEIVYLFNSAFSPLYQRNLLKTIAIPRGSINYVRYTISRNVPPELVENFENNKRKVKQRLLNKDGLFIFVDRFAQGGYKYYPLRRLKITSVDIEHDKLMIYFEVRKCVHCPNVDDFSQELTKILKNALPRLTNNDPENIHDGYYVNKGIDISEKISIFEESEQDNTWKKIVNQIKEARAYSDFSDEKDYLYVNIKGVYDLKNNIIKPKMSKDGKS